MRWPAAVMAIALGASGATADSLEDEDHRQIEEWLRERTNPSIAARLEAAEALLGEEFSFADVAILLEWIDTERSPWVRRALLEAVVEFDDDYWATTILGFLEDPDPNLRRLAAESAAGMVDAPLEARLIDALGIEPYWWVRVPIVEALGEGLRDESLDLLHDALGDPVREVRGAAVEALREREDPRSFHPLLSLLMGESLPGTDSPVTALAAIGEERAIPFLEQALTSPHPIVKEMAEAALRRFDPPDDPAPKAEPAGLDAEEVEVVTAGTSAEVVTVRTSCLVGFKEPSSYDPEVRLVSPPRGLAAPLWIEVPLEGIAPAIQVPRGARVALQEVVAGGRTVWYSVTGRMGEGWMREEDLRPLTPDEMK